MRRWEIFVGGSRYVVVSGSGPADLEGTRELGQVELLALIRRWLAEERDKALRDLAEITGISEPSGPSTGSELAPRLIAAVEERFPLGVRVFEEPRREVPLLLELEAPVDLADLASEPVEDAPVLTWVEVEFRGTDNRPLRDVAVKIELPDGSVVDDKTDAFGVVRVQEIAEPGTCTFKFPEVEQLEPVAS
ncbi:MAG: hypothetical protein AAGF11_23685 [Myxococcota bacterium]